MSASVSSPLSTRLKYSKMDLSPMSAFSGAAGLDVDVRILRVLRLVRVFRVVKLGGRYGKLQVSALS